MWRRLLLVAGLAGLALVVILNYHQLKSFVEILKTLRWYALVAIIVVQVFGYYLNALYYQSILKVFKFNIPTIRLFKGAMAANFVNYLVPSAGIAGAGFFSEVLSPEVPRGQGVLVQIMRYGLSALGVLMLLPLGLILVAFSSHHSSTIEHISIYLSLLVLAGAMTIVALVHQELWLRKATKRFEKIIRKLFKNSDLDHFDQFVDDFFSGYRLLVKQKLRVAIPYLWSVVYVLEEMLTLYLAFLAFGRVVNPGIVIMGYLMANVGSAIGGSLFSFGVFELSMLGTFVALGIHFPLALSITLVYRVLNLIIGLPAGFYYYRQILKK